MKYTKLKKNLPIEEKMVEFDNHKIKINTYLPVDKKLEMIGRIITSSQDQNRFYNPGKLEVLFDIFLLRYYTDIDFGDTVDEPGKLYDEITVNGLIKLVKDQIPQSEIDWLKNNLNDTVTSIYSYNNSVLGLMEQISKDYSNLGIEASEIAKALQDPKNLELVKGILTKLS